MLSVSFLPFPELRTERLLLRQLKQTDVNQVYILKSDEDVLRYLGNPKYEDPMEAQRFIDKINKGISTNTWVYWALSIKGSDKLIGTVCLWNLSKDESAADIGYELLPEYQGQGFMLEAVTAALNYAFDTGFKTVYAILSSDNQNSLKLLKRSGFICKSTFQEFNGLGKKVDMSVYYKEQP